MDRSYKGLFGSEDDDNGADEGAMQPSGSRFMQYFGWQYSAKLIADHENIRVEEVYDRSTIEALNTLSYLKAKTDYDKELQRRL